jgi:glycosyltransferase involved in cell wall biosynthesis
MNIVLAIQSLEIGGAERQVVELAHGLRLLGRNVSICCLNRLGPLADEARHRGITVDCFNKTNRGDLRVIDQLTKYLLRNQANVLHTFLFGANLWGTLAGRRAGVSVLLTSDRSGGYYEEKKELCADRLLHAYTDGMITNTSVGKQRIRRQIGIQSDRIHVIFNGMNLERFEKKQDPMIMRQVLGFAPASFVVALSGTMRPIKNPLMFMKMARILIAESERFMFLVIGGGPDIPRMQALTKQLGINDRIRFTGPRHDVPELLQASDAGVLCSHWEGFSNSIMEYMAAGLPVVATDVGGNRDLVQQQYTGFLVRPDDARQMSERLHWLAVDNVMARSFGDAGKAWVRKNCNIMDLAGKTAKIYDEILKYKGCSSL